jgi:amidohydrolase
MDALPIVEANATEYVSASPGKMHACGHDGHTSIGLAVARMLSGRRAEMHGRVKFVFQPAEEIGEGARAMVADGVLANPRPDISLGLHLWNELPLGLVGVTSGPAMAAADTWNCTLTGAGGHGAAPHLAIDPVVAAAQVVTALQTIVSRNVEPLDSGVVTVGAIHGGEAYNIIPQTVEMKGTLRAFRNETRDLLRRRLAEICTQVAGALGCTAEVEVGPMTGAVANDPVVAERVAEIAARRVGADRVRRDVRTMGAEDMSALMENIPGCFFFVGSANAARDLAYSHHNPRFDFDESALVTAAALLAEAAASYVIPG